MHTGNRRISNARTRWRRPGLASVLCGFSLLAYGQSPIVLNEVTLLMNRGQYAEADLELQRALLTRPNQPTYLTLQGVIALRMEDYGRAQECFTRAAVHDPGNPMAHFNLGEVSFLRRNMESALSAYGQVTEPSELHPLAAYKQILCLLYLGRREEAEKRTQRLQVSEENPAFYYAHAALAFDQGNFDEGRYFASVAVLLYHRQSQVYRIPLIEAGWLSR